MTWTFEDLRDRYERGRNLSKDFVITDDGRYIFYSNDSPTGEWTVTRISPGNYTCTCPDFTSERYQDLMKSGWSSWRYSQWTHTAGVYEQLRSECKHVLAVSNFIRDIDPNYPFPQLLTPQDGLNKPSCGCSTGKPCRCQKKAIASTFQREQPRLLGGCVTRCYVPSLTPPQVTKPSWDNQFIDGLVAASTLPQLVLIAANELCGDFNTTLTVQRIGNLQGYIPAEILVFVDDEQADGINFVMPPDQSAYQIDYFVWASPFSIVSFQLRSPLVEVVEPSMASLPVKYCPPCEVKLLADDSEIPGLTPDNCINNFRHLKIQTGEQLRDGSCEQLDYYDYDENFCDPNPNDPFPDDPFPDDPFPDFPPLPDDPSPDFPPLPPFPPFPPSPGGACRFTIYKDCTAEDFPFPECAAFGYKGQVCGNNGESAIDNFDGICVERCLKDCTAIDIPQCENPPCTPAVWVCPEKPRYIGWVSVPSNDGNYSLDDPVFAGVFSSGNVDIDVLDRFYCQEDRIVWVLMGYSKPPTAYLKDGGCITTPEPKCNFAENTPSRPVCSPSKVCVEYDFSSTPLVCSSSFGPPGASCRKLVQDLQGQVVYVYVNDVFLAISTNGFRIDYQGDDIPGYDFATRISSVRTYSSGGLGYTDVPGRARFKICTIFQ